MTLRGLSRVFIRGAPPDHEPFFVLHSLSYPFFSPAFLPSTPIGFRYTATQDIFMSKDSMARGDDLNQARVLIEQFRYQAGLDVLNWGGKGMVFTICTLESPRAVKIPKRKTLDFGSDVRMFLQESNLTQLSASLPPLAGEHLCKPPLKQPV